MIIEKYDNFIKVILNAGFSMGGENPTGIYSFCESVSENIKWHTENLETDPWEWRMRVLNERDDIAYAKLFFKKSGYLSKEWYPCFLAIRRGRLSFEEQYLEGTISADAKKIYECIKEYGVLPLHQIKINLEITKENKSKFDRGLVELQMKLFITMCGKKQKISQEGEGYGWASTVFCLTEQYFDQEVFDEASELTQEEAIERITTQIYVLNKNAKEKDIMKFIKG